MKKLISLIIVSVILMILPGCGNQDLIDTVYTFDYAIVKFPDDTAKTIEIAKWKTYQDGDQIQIIAEDGTVYLMHSTNCILVQE